MEITHGGDQDNGSADCPDGLGKLLHFVYFFDDLHGH